MIWAKTGIYLCRYNVDWYYPKKKSNEYVIIHKHKLSWNARSMANGRCCVLQKGKNGAMPLNIDKNNFFIGVPLEFLFFRLSRIMQLHPKIALFFWILEYTYGGGRIATIGFFPSSFSSPAELCWQNFLDHLPAKL